MKSKPSRSKPVREGAAGSPDTGKEKEKETKPISASGYESILTFLAELLKRMTQTFKGISPKAIDDLRPRAGEIAEMIRRMLHNDPPVIDYGSEKIDNAVAYTNDTSLVLPQGFWIRICMRAFTVTKIQLGTEEGGEFRFVEAPAFFEVQHEDVFISAQALSRLDVPRGGNDWTQYDIRDLILENRVASQCTAKFVVEGG